MSISFLKLQPILNLCERLLMDTSPRNSCTAQSVLMLYLQLVPVEFFACFSKRLKLRCAVFTLPVVIWLMIFQRLHDHGSLAVAVQQVVWGLASFLIPRPSKRLREGTVSSHTGGYNQARQRLPLEVVQKVSDVIFERLAPAEPNDRMFILDGSTLLMPNTPALRKAYPPARNQHGESHWPILRVLVAHDLDSGVAVRPEWGPVSISEQQLTEKLLERLPCGAAVMGDQNFGVFSVAWAAQRHGHPVLLRLTPARRKYAFGSVEGGETDSRVVWKPSRHDRKKHPEFPLDACIHGRLIDGTVFPSDGSGPIQLHLFTTLDLPAEDIVRIYGLRWNVETDLRTIKKTIRLEMLNCRTPEMVAKELILAVTAYNLVRAIINESAERTQLSPRQYSFSRVRALVNAWAPRIAAISSEKEQGTEFEVMMRYVAQCRIYKRKRPSYPRKVWKRRCTFPPQKEQNNARPSGKGKRS